MKFNVKDIRLDGIDVVDQIDADVIGLTEKDEVSIVDPLDVNAHFQRIETTVLARTNVHSRLKSVCYRCLEEVDQDWSQEFVLNFPLDRNTEVIELDEEIRQEVLMNLPDRILCKQDCKGLCGNCGVNLNIEKCKCKA